MQIPIPKKYMDKLINLKESEMINFGWFRDTIIAFLMTQNVMVMRC